MMVYHNFDTPSFYCLRGAGELPLNVTNFSAGDINPRKGGFILLSAGNAGGIPVAQVHLLLTQPRRVG